MKKQQHTRSKNPHKLSASEAKNIVGGWRDGAVHPEWDKSKQQIVYVQKHGMGPKAKFEILDGNERGTWLTKKQMIKRGWHRPD